MPRELLREAREQADRAEPAVKAAALLHIARALAPFDQTEAEQVLDTGIALAQGLQGKTRSIILGEAVFLAAAVSPARALPLYAAVRRDDKRDSFGCSVVRLVNTMATHGHADEAISYLDQPLRGDRFPLYMVNNISRECRNDQTRLKLLRSAMAAWRDAKPDDLGPGGHGRDAFVVFFDRYWNLLPREEAVRTLQEIVKWILRGADQPRRMPITGNPGDPEFTSERPYLLFRLLPSLRRLDPPLTNSLLEKNVQLAVAARRFPFGMESVQEESRDQGGVCEDFMMIGKSSGTPEDPPNCRVIPVAEALANDFAEAFEEAFHRYRYDSDPESPNEAPKECWPSTHEFRNILFKAARHIGKAAAKYLERIPDADLRLFAQIEMCAAIAGQPQTGHAIHYHKPPAPRRRGA